MEAAITAVNCGHSVILCESTEKLGGLLRYARKVPFKKDTEEYLDYMIREVGRLPIDVRLNTRVTPELIEELAPDAVIAAIGGQAKVPAIPGAAELAHPIMALYDDEVELGERVAIIGGGLTGSEAALELAMKGHKVTLIHRHSDIAREANSMHKPALMMQFKKYADHITILRDTSCDEVKEHSVVCHDKDGAVFEVETDTVILALGLNALREEADRLYLAAEDGAIVGDCRKPRRIADAVREAHDAVMAL